jgi:HrpA-like RNA helicase
MNLKIRYKRKQIIQNMQQASLPKMPSLADLGLTINDIRGTSRSTGNKTSDGSKKVPYNANRTRSVRVNQPPSSEPKRYQASPQKVYPILPITSHGEAIAQLILQNPVSAIDVSTGGGKTRYIPYLMAMKGYKVRVAIPTTVAVRDAHKFQRDHSTLRVGYAAGREIHYSDDDQLVYMTTGHLTQRIIGMLKSGNLSALSGSLGDILFIDEVHTATSHITVLIGLMRYLIDSEKQKIPRIVFATATLNRGDIVDYFPEFPVYKADIPSYPIENIFLSKPRDLLRDDPNDEIVRIINEELVRWQAAPKKFHGIVFRPGLQEVEDTIEYLESKFSTKDMIEFYPAYSNLGPVELDEIFEPSNRMKVIVGTNIIESSITVEDVGFIIDDMLEKIAETSSTGGNKLTLIIISKSASQQRRGRTGRTMPGRDYKLIDRLSYETLPEFRLREIDRIPIFDIVLQLIDADLDPREVLKISINRYDQARRFLIDVGMIENRADRYFVTDIGRFVSSLSIGVQSAYMVYLGFQRFQEVSQRNMDAERIVLRSVLAVAAMIESYGPSYFYIPRRGRNETIIEYTARKDAHIDRYHEKFRGQTDIHTFINIFWEMMASINVAKKYDQGSRNTFTNYVKEWSVNNSMNNKKIKEYLNVMRDIESVVESKLNDNTPLRADLPNSGQAQILPRGQLGGKGYSLGRDLPDGGYTN